MLVRPASSSIVSSIRSATPRTLFTLPDLSSLSPFYDPGNNSEEPQTYNEKKILPYRPSELYRVVSDVSSYPTFVPFCTGARILKPLRPSLAGPRSSVAPQPSTMEAELTVGFLSFKESYTSTVKCLPNTSVQAIASSSTPLFKSLSTTWTFQPVSHHPRRPIKGPLLPKGQSHTRHSSTTTSISPKDDITPTKDPDSPPTLVTLDLSFAFANPVHAAVSAAFFGQVSKMMVKAFEERCFEVYGPGYR
ncbi:hypothetical protein NLI96_g1216 [Meripilus lineatus]|uniref:Coenzyme Q-binding protein COQ10 START domain-containing protein n=1 Tax=Meripilus lineatus TaxID=2056292 RepID=A0AAD5VGF0_9APHY|nr:hypothetical protein NLI96_g1216 [Physisporinus lineatus]